MQTQTRELFRKYTDPDTFERIVEFGTVSEMWEHSLATWPDAPAIVDNGNTYTFAQLEQDVAGFRTLLGAPATGTRVAMPRFS